jgi:hypothetical protein
MRCGMNENEGLVSIEDRHKREEARSGIGTNPLEQRKAW